MQHDDKLSPATLAAQGLGTTTMPHRDIVPPIHMATTFERTEDGSLRTGRGSDDSICPRAPGRPLPSYCPPNSGR